MQSSKIESDSVWEANSLITRLTQAKQDGTLAKMSNRWEPKDIDIDLVTQTLSTLETQIERADFLAFSCPSFYFSIR